MVAVGDARVSFTASGAARVVRGAAALALADAEIDPLRSQGDIGLFVPDAGYPFGPLPDWLLRQRAVLPEWAPAWAKRLRDERP